MPKQKDLKRVVRTRMQKTGESYTTARLHLVNKRIPAADLHPEKEQPAAAPDYAALAGLSDASVKKATGCNWEKWVVALDRAEGTEMSHRALAAHIHDKYHTPSWWTQMVAVGYERIRGLRAHGQQRGGDWRVSKSKTIAVPLAKLYAAFRIARRRGQWLTGLPLTIRGATPNKSMRFRLEDGSPVEVLFSARGEGKSQVAIEHSKLSTKADADRLRVFWTERLEALAAMLKS
jgi:hypothetical protein